MEPDGGRVPLRQAIDRPRGVSLADGGEIHWTTKQSIIREPCRAAEPGESARELPERQQAGGRPTRRASRLGDELRRPRKPVSGWWQALQRPSDHCRAGADL